MALITNLVSLRIERTTEPPWAPVAPKTTMSFFSDILTSGESCISKRMGYTRPSSRLQISRVDYRGQDRFQEKLPKELILVLRWIVSMKNWTEWHERAKCLYLYRKAD